MPPTATLHPHWVSRAAHIMGQVYWMPPGLAVSTWQVGEVTFTLSWRGPYALLPGCGTVDKLLPNFGTQFPLLKGRRRL